MILLNEVDILVEETKVGELSFNEASFIAVYGNIISEEGKDSMSRV